MSRLTITEADNLLSHSAAWLALDDDTKERHISTAILWLNYTYEWRGCIASCPVPQSTLSGYPYTFPAVYTESQAMEAAA
ncbi:hypothetical protein, partial [uncultured Paraglaciecola sp.]|uniref:hypothetical protein n=1 Tax=uncultured Paraglaciecola sp. TaxID=1765024 RepID=UPI0026277277